MPPVSLLCTNGARNSPRGLAIADPDTLQVAKEMILYNVLEDVAKAVRSGCQTGLKQRFGESRVDLMAYGRTQWS
jgi:hypothetical protein